MQADGFRELLRDAQAGDRAAAERLLAVVRQHLAQSAVKFADVGHAAESTSDLVQEASLKLWQRLDQFRGGESDEECLAMFLAWSVQIVNRLGLNAQRDRSTQRRSPAGPVLRLATRSGDGADSGWPAEPASAGQTPSANVRAGEEATVIRDAVNRLPDELDRAMLRLRFFEGRSLRQIAEELPLSYDQVRDRFRAIMQRLERELEGLL